MWFLIETGGRAGWLRVHVNVWHPATDMATVKRQYREHGVPILAIARLKPRTVPEPYDDVRG